MWSRCWITAGVRVFPLHFLLTRLYCTKEQLWVAPTMQSSQDNSPFLQTVREAIRVRHFSIRTEEAYVQWVKRFILFHGKRHPAEMGEREVAAFLTYLAVEGQVAAATQNQALNALVFLYVKSWSVRSGTVQKSSGPSVKRRSQSCLRQRKSGLCEPCRSSSVTRTYERRDLYARPEARRAGGEEPARSRLGHRHPDLRQGGGFKPRDTGARSAYPRPAPQNYPATRPARVRGWCGDRRAGADARRTCPR